MMKKITLVIILSWTACSVRAQYALGTTGQLLIPSAEMQKTGTFMGGANFLPEAVTPERFAYPTVNYFVNMTLFSFVELNYRSTLLKFKNREGKMTYHNQDRSNTVRIRPLKESRYFPAIVFGIDDLLFTDGESSRFWGAYYGVLTKTLNCGQGNELAVTTGWYLPAGKHHYNKGPFGGIRYTPSFCRELKLMAEYDTHGWNAGGAIRFWKHLSVSLFTREFTCISAGLRYECVLMH